MLEIPDSGYSIWSGKLEIIWLNNFLKLGEENSLSFQS